MQDHRQDYSSARSGKERSVLLVTLLALFLLLLAGFAAPAFVQASWSPTIEQDVDPDRGCRDASGAELSPDRCKDPCDDAAAAHGGKGDDCEDPCADLVGAAWGGGGGGGDKDCPLPCPTVPPAPTITPTSTVPPAPTVTPTETPPPAPTVTPTETPPPAPTTVAAHGGGGGGGGGDHDRIRFDCETDDAYGRIVALPVPVEAVEVEAAHSGKGGLKRADFNGEWVVDDRTFTVTDDTILNTRYGRFEVGKCVEVTWGVENPTLALMIESKQDHKCGKPDAPVESTLWGAVLAVPDDPNQIGEWTVGGIVFSVTADTKIHVSPWKDAPIVVGDFVKVTFSEVNGVRTATSIHAIWPFNIGHPWWKWHMGRAFGTIDALPDGGGIGTWEIAGFEYTVTERTRLDDANGAFAVGVNVKVEYFKMVDGTRLARKIETTEDTGGGNGSFRFVGVVDAKPTAFVGSWLIGGAVFVADTNTLFNEENGLLVSGAYVAVRYTIVDDIRLASEIKTEIPPGGGGTTHFGVIERRGLSTMPVAAADGQAQNLWRIGGQEFLVTEGTLLNDELSALDEGRRAYVDAYVAPDGTLVATSIEGMGAQYLPMMQSQ